MNDRLGRLRQRFLDEQLDALLVTSAPNRRYLSGFTGSAGALLITADHALLLSDFRYQTQGTREAPAFEFRLVPNGALVEHLPGIVRSRTIDRLGFEANDLTVAQYAQLQESFGRAQVAVE